MSQETQFGFVWDQVSVERTTELPEGRKVITVSTEAGNSIEIYVSSTGSSLRVFSKGKEWKP